MAMLNHISIGVHDTENVARVLAELWNGYAMPFPFAPRGWVVFADDGLGTMVEVVTAQTVLEPGERLPAEADYDSTYSTEEFEAKFVERDTAPQFVATHMNINTPLSAGEVKAIADREGWRCFLANRGEGLFQLFELWIENHFMLEVMTPEMTENYIKLMQPQNWADLLEMPLPPKQQAVYGVR